MLRPHHVDLLILGAGWTSTFLLPLLRARAIPHAATSTTGREHTIPFTFDPAAPDADLAPYARLPPATTVLVTFPLKGPGQAAALTRRYAAAHPDAPAPAQWLQLGSTGIFAAPHWNDAASPYDTANARAVAEDELLAGAHGPACVLNLAGLYGGARQPRDWVTRVATSKEAVKAKGALHLVHGADVARAVLAAHERFAAVAGRRWIVADLHVYDWWELFFAWDVDGEGGGALGRRALQAGKVGAEAAQELQYQRWVGELMVEEGVRALPREKEALGRVLDSREFWNKVGIWPSVGRVS